MNPMIDYAYLDTPIGRLLLANDAGGLRYVEFDDARRDRRITADWRHSEKRLAPVLEQFAAYFAGELLNFDLPLSPHGSDFQRAVWDLLVTIPYGETTSYGAIARRLGRPDSSRAVGAANGSNPLPIIVPCHRVIGSNGQLTGFGGGLPTKRWLLEHERRHAPPRVFALG